MKSGASATDFWPASDGVARRGYRTRFDATEGGGYHSCSHGAVDPRGVEEDVITSVALQANAATTKPVDPSAFIETVRTDTERWLDVFRLPPTDLV